MKDIILLNKKEGETPLEALEVFRLKHPRYQNIKLTYAGRLDPMASGVLLVLAGGEVQKKEKYLKLDKEYEFEVLFGFATDTYDILGKVVSSHRSDLWQKDVLERATKRNLKFFKGKITQKYPMYSSKTVAGKQLWQHAREGGEVEAPEREVYVKSLKYLGLKKVSNKKLLVDIERRINKVKGDFRQKEILKAWQKELKQEGEKLFIASFKIKCSSGTYVRSISFELGERVGIPALAYKIKRTRTGRYKY